jgi:hypothetical protein
MDFASDNAVGASPLVLDALLAPNHGAVPTYGHDPFRIKPGNDQQRFETRGYRFLRRVRYRTKRAGARRDVSILARDLQSPSRLRCQ